jgi:nucleoside-diphosphate-sugar epimerase
MRILIIGGTGFSGPHTVRRLAAMGHTIVLFHRGQTEAQLPDGVEHILGDQKNMIRCTGELRSLAPEIVLHMIPVTKKDAQSVMRIFRGVARRVIAVSSQDVYRAYGRLIGIEAGPPDPVPLDEDAPLRSKLYPYREQVNNPNHPFYHYDKIPVERVIMGDPELPGTILRFPMVYGPRDRQHRLFNYLRRMDDGRPAILLSENMAHWRWTRGYVENVAAATALAVTDDRASGQIYNVGELDALREAEWIRAIGKAAGWDGDIIPVPRALLPKNLAPGINTEQDLVTDATRIQEELGYAEPVLRDEALRRTVIWDRAHPPKEIDSETFDYATEDEVLAKPGQRKRPG